MKNSNRKKSVASHFRFQLKPIYFNRKRIIYSLLASIALLCTTQVPAIAKIPAPSTTIPSQSIPIAQKGDRLQQGKTFYDAGKYAEAVNILQQALQDYRTKNDTLKQALALSNLSLTYQQLGAWTEAKQAIDESLKLLGYAAEKTPDSRLPCTGAQQCAPTDSRTQEVLAQALDIQARLQLLTGEAETAIETWGRSAALYTQVGNKAGEIRSQINSVQALRAMGLYSRALTKSTEINKSLGNTPASLTKAVSLRSLGEVLQQVGDLEQSRKTLQESLQIAQSLPSAPETAATLLSLGNTVSAQGDTDAALDYYQQAEKSAPTASTKLQAQLNQLQLLSQTQRDSAARELIPQIETQLAQLPPSRATVYAHINFADSLMKLGSRGKRAEGAQGAEGATTNYQLPTTQEIAQVLATAVQQARSLKDPRAEAYALGSLGGLYEQVGQLAEAKKLTQQALLITQSIDAPDIAYSWQWQLGRLLKAEKDNQGAIAAYADAVKTLQSLRNDLVSINPTVQFSFRESVEPVYRQFVGLLLQDDGTQPSQENLNQARTVFESLKAAELVDFFRAACLDTQPTQIDRVDPQAAVIYPVILEDRLEVIVSLPKQPLRHYATALPRTQVESAIDQLRQNLVIRYSQDFLTLSQQVYDWLIRPAAADIEKSGVTTLVFVLDISLQKLPMAALHDGKQFLVQKYSVALTPSLELLQPQPLSRERLRALTAGLTEPRGDYPALTNVALELNQIRSEVPGRELLNQNFTSTSLRNQIKSLPFSIVHIASHAQFGSQADQTYILAWDGPINVKQLDELLRVREPSSDLERPNAIELLVLSGCRTVAGDRRAALGMAGVAVRAGARSTLATLWYVSDAATVPLMSQFYQELSTAEMTKAEALRRAQLALLQNPRYRHPVYWAPYVLVGNWL
ncbi:CHAT domain-containing protein [Chroococcidiopsis thermalis]|uniref:Tetratricopeptide TPR_1 repeat-containing protein n=1 Tax=Chroococcidiopsis thermalis (strain PCC 7203) TaxID=251229 RepID=K9TVJ8_CHRTP|nr:CHAT domain-containing protein [Chroococcidiopsis thermalis]AFY86029.1 Tetratricopeptide TPR_1 repeat-containing protein [Chroococcidiopsis thermalis PCC 7203]